MKQVAYQRFTSIEGLPWIGVTIVQSEKGNYASLDEPLLKANLIAIVCVKSNEMDIKILLSIAQRLGWKLFREEDEEGLQDIEIIESE